MWLNRALLFLLLVSLAFPSGYCCRGRCTRATVIAVGAVASSIVTGITTYWEKFHSYFEKQINDFSWNALGWFAATAQQKVTEGKFPPVIWVRDPPKHNCITRSEELTQLKEMFNSFDTSTSDKVVYAVYLVGLPGSGKSELARQYGNLLFERGEVSTVITLSTESEEQFRDDVIQAIIKLKAAEGTDTKKKDYNEETIEDLIEELQKLLTGRRPGWLLIVDNIRNTNITRGGFYKKLPNPGTKNWGKGYMLLTTQVFLLEEDKFVKIKKTNKGMTPNDAKQFLCELVNRGKGDCPDGDAEAIVKRLEYLPLGILAAGTFIEKKMKWKSYTIAEYLQTFDNENSKALNISMSSKTDYPHSMRTALLLAVQNSVEGDSDANAVKDFCAFVGFINKEEIRSKLVQSYLEMKGHSEESIQKLIYFPLVDFLEDKKVFRVHQVTRDAFRAELIERSTRHSARGDLLLENIQYISHFFFIGFETDKGMLWEANSYFHYVRSHHDYSLNDIISPDENLEVAASLVFRLVEGWSLYFPRPFFSCSILEHFVARLLSAPENTGNTSYLRFTGCRLVHYCLQKDEQTDLSEKYAVKGVEIIKELVPESPELHTKLFFERRYVYEDFDYFSSVVIPFIQSVEPTDKEDSDRLYLSFLRVVTVLYGWSLHKLGWFGSSLLENEMLNGARVWLEGIRHRCQSGGTEDRYSECFDILLDLGMTYLKLKQYNAAEDILLQVRESDTPWPFLGRYQKYKTGCMLAEVQIRLHKYSEALFSLEEVLDGYGILIHGNWTLCVGNYFYGEGFIYRICLATEVLEIYHSLYISVPDNLHETMRRVEHKLMQLLTEILSCEYLEDEKLARMEYVIFQFGVTKLFRFHHIIKNQISHNHTRDLTELTIGVAEILVKRTKNPSSLVDELRVTVTTGLTLPLSVVNLLQDSLKKQVNAAQSPCTYPEFTNFSLIAFRLFVPLAFLLGTLAFFKCVEHAQPDRPFTLILTIAFGTVLFLFFLWVITSIFS